MAEYIKREDAIRAAKNAWAKGIDPSQYIESIPADDVAPVVHGKWISVGAMFDIEECKCSICEKHITNVLWKRLSYCPHCGAKMDLEAEK